MPPTSFSTAHSGFLISALLRDRFRHSRLGLRDQFWLAAPCGLGFQLRDAECVVVRRLRGQVIGPAGFARL
jgi:hypothetical protein